MRFAPKLILLMLVIISCTIFTIVFFTLNSNIKILEGQIKDRLEKQAVNTTDVIDRILFERYSDINLMGGGLFIDSKSTTPRQITERMIQYRNQLKYYVSLSFYSINGIKIADTEGLNIGKTIGTPKYWEEVKKYGISAASDISIDEDLKIPVIYFASLVKDNNSQPFGVVVARMPVTKLYEVTENILLSNNDKEQPYIDLINQEGLLLYSNYNKRGLLKDNLISLDNATKKWVEGGLGNVVRANSGGENFLYVFSKERGYLNFKGNNWTLIIKIPTEIAFASISEYEKKLTLIMIPVVLISFLLVIGFSRFFSRPIIELRNAAREVGKGNLDVRVGYNSKDELGQLTGSFNEMTKNLKSSREMIENWTKTLEKRVDQKTKEYKKAAQLAQNTKEFAESVVNTIKEPLVVLDSNLDIISASKSFYLNFKTQPENIVGKQISVFSKGRWAIGNLYRKLENVLKKNETIENFEIKYSIPDIGTRIFLLNARKVLYSNELDNGSKAILLTFEDITERKKTEEELRHIGLHDALTDLPNRLLFFDRLEIAIENAKRNNSKLAVMMLDIDNLKFVNDTNGHAKGDELIKYFSEHILNIIRKTDTLARIGGDEFILLVTNIKSENDINIVARKINEITENNVNRKDFSIKISASIGIAIYPEDSSDIDMLVKYSDKAMYAVKKSNKGTFAFYKNLS
jgi:diguanylate cyclase (GGDEF)-like protein